MPTEVTSDFYDNRFVVLPEEVTYRPQLDDGHGGRLHPKPRIQGTLSAIVVSDGEPLLSDRDHRIKVQFPWQRGGDASSGLSHPSGEDNAPASAQAWTCVQVSAPNAHLLATAAGAYLKLEGGNIELGAPGRVEFKASQREWTGGQSTSGAKPFLPNAEWTNWIEINHRDFDDEPFAGQAYKIFFQDGTVIAGKLDDQGHAHHENVPQRAERVEYEWPPLKDDPRWDPWQAILGAAENKLG